MAVIKRDPDSEPGYRDMQKNCVSREGREAEYADTLHEVGIHHPDWSVSRRIRETYELMGLTARVPLPGNQRYRRP